VLAQSWNLLAGYTGLVSVGQQAFVGLGAYVMFPGVVLLGARRRLSSNRATPQQWSRPTDGRMRSRLRLAP
jgi:ABC-type branched-subunit amino acid transport system permease subunit